MNTFFVVPNEDKEIFETSLTSVGVEFSTREGVAKDSTRFDFEADGNTIVMVGMNYGVELSFRNRKELLNPTI